MGYPLVVKRGLLKNTPFDGEKRAMVLIHWQTFGTILGTT